MFPKPPKKWEPKILSLKDKLTFGKYKGETIAAILKKDPSYVKEAHKAGWFKLKKAAAKKVKETKVRKKPKSFFYTVPGYDPHDGVDYQEDADLFDAFGGY